MAHVQVGSLEDLTGVSWELYSRLTTCKVPSCSGVRLCRHSLRLLQTIQDRATAPLLSFIVNLQTSFKYLLGPPKEPKTTAQHPRIETIGSIGSIVLAILEVQVNPKFEESRAQKQPVKVQVCSDQLSEDLNGLAAEELNESYHRTPMTPIQRPRSGSLN